MSKHKDKPVDMSLPPEQRSRRRKSGSIGGTPPAQVSRASGSRADRERRDGERKMEIERCFRTDAARRVEAAAEVAALDDEKFAARVLARVPEDSRPAMKTLLQSLGCASKTEED